MDLLTLPEPIYVLTGEIDEEKANKLGLWLMSNRKSKHLSIVLNTRGGCVHSAIGIHEMLANLQECGIEIHIAVHGVCQSAGITILTGVKPERRYGGRNSRYLVHPIRSTKDDKHIVIDIDRPDPALLREMESMCDHPMTELFEIRELLIKLLVQGSKIGEEEAAALINGESYFSVEKAIAYGLVGSILEGKPPASTKKRRWHRNR